MRGEVTGGPAYARGLTIAFLLAATLDAQAPPQASPAATALVSLRAFEAEERERFDPENPPSSETDLGADPWAILRLPEPGPARYVGILRGRSAVVLLDASLHELSRAPAPRSPTALTRASNGDIVVAGELSPTLAVYEVGDASLREKRRDVIEHVASVRDVAAGPNGAIYALAGADGLLVTMRQQGFRVCAGASQLVATTAHVLVNCPLTHAIAVFSIAEDGQPIEASRADLGNDGPFWGIDARESARGLVVVAGGVEDHPLDRSGGFFGNIDSFVTTFVVDSEAPSRATKSATNVSELGIVTPKAVRIVSVEPLVVDVAGFGSGVAARLTLDRASEPRVAPFESLPGSRMVDVAPDGTRVVANPLLDAWVKIDTHATAIPIGGEPPKRGRPLEVGEALLFTTLMAPRNDSRGSLSRFTCEACHFEGGIDGRTHHTGRGAVFVATKPLFGLGTNKPHFSRALDPDLSAVAMNEFRVATAGNHYDPWFAIDVAEQPWLRSLGVAGEKLSPEELRRSFVAFTLGFSHRPNPAVIGRRAFDSLERRGAELFAEDCVRCHASRLVADDPSTEVPFDTWERFVFSDASPIVWARDGYERTGVEPYVHAEGARTPSLRRLFRKRPYFTNGSARDLSDVLDRVRVGESGVLLHAGDRAGARGLSLNEKGAIGAFLELL